MEKVIVKTKNAAKIWMEEQEICREYYKTDKITFGMSELPPGAVGGMDIGHSEADEVFSVFRERFFAMFRKKTLIIILFQGMRC